MKELNLPENQLHGWRPRRPSDRLKQRIFRVATERSTLALNWSGLAPAMVCLLFVLMAMHFNGANLWSHSRILTATSTNQGAIYWEPAGGQVSENQLHCVTFDWTNHGNFQSSIAFASRTNSSN